MGARAWPRVVFPSVVETSPSAITSSPAGSTHGFRDFVGLPERVADRRYHGPLEYRLPIPRLPDSPVNQGKRLLD
jgi:hypothetical protein